MKEPEFIVGIFPPEGDVGIAISSEDPGKLAGFQFEAVFQSVVFPTQVLFAGKIAVLTESRIIAKIKKANVFEGLIFFSFIRELLI